MTGPLDGVRVVELTQGLSGPYCSMLLSDAGASVTKIEPPGGDYARGYGPPFIGDEGAQFLELNRNKRGMVLDIERAEGRLVLERLLLDADVLVTDFNPARAAELDLAYDAIERVNSRIVQCNITPFGERGPMADQPGAELVIQGMAEYTASVGTTGEPPVRLGADVAQLNTGAQAVQGILAALLMRERTGEGQFVDVNMLRTLMHLRGMMWTSHSEGADDWWGFHQDTYVKPADHGYRTSDGHMLLRGGGPPEEFAALLDDLGIADEVRGDPRWENAGAVMGGGSRFGWQVKDVWDRGLEDKTTQEVIELLESHGMDGFPVNNYETLFADPQLDEIGMVQETSHPSAGNLRTLGSPWLFAVTPAAIQGPAPTLGQHTDELLGAFGYGPPEVEGLRRAGIAS
jgi:crotonobetainyl-CoA:carnitine CoA-transferase CaiB-like acyl-CoA transferase